MALGHHGCSRIVVDVLAVAILAQAIVQIFTHPPQTQFALLRLIMAQGLIRSSHGDKGTSQQRLGVKSKLLVTVRYGANQWRKPNGQSDHSVSDQGHLAASG